MMKEKVVEILIYLMSEIQGEKALQDIDLSDLKSRGYTQSEITSAVSWLFEHVHGIETGTAASFRPGRDSRRVLHEAERMAFSTAAQGYLIQLAELKLLDDKDLELVIERAMVSGYEKLTVPEVRDVVAAVLFAKEGNLPGSNHSLPMREDTIH
jgi:uncharacterized protein Smg (DUF494 family)